MEQPQLNYLFERKTKCFYEWLGEVVQSVKQHEAKAAIKKIES